MSGVRIQRSAAGPPIGPIRTREVVSLPNVALSTTPASSLRWSDDRACAGGKWPRRKEIGEEAIPTALPSVIPRGECITTTDFGQGG